MASIVKPYLDNLASISDRLSQIAKDAVTQNSAEIVMLVKSNQLGRGLNSEGRPLTWASGDGFYAMATQTIFDGDTEGSASGNRVGKAYRTPYNFSWTGSTLDLMTLKLLSGDAFLIFTADSKMAMLEEIYGEIFQLTPEHNEYVNNEIILPYLQKFVLDNLFNV